MKEDGAFLGDEVSTSISPFPFPNPGLGGSLLVAAVSPTVGSATTLDFLGERSTFSDNFLLADRWA